MCVYMCVYSYIKITIYLIENKKITDLMFF